jgi:hypothetical protein
MPFGIEGSRGFEPRYGTPRDFPGRYHSQFSPAASEAELHRLSHQEV